MHQYSLKVKSEYLGVQGDPWDWTSAETQYWSHRFGLQDGPGDASDRSLRGCSPQWCSHWPACICGPPLSDQSCGIYPAPNWRRQSTMEIIPDFISRRQCMTHSKPSNKRGVGWKGMAHPKHSGSNVRLSCVVTQMKRTERIQNDTW